MTIRFAINVEAVVGGDGDVSIDLTGFLGTKRLGSAGGAVIIDQNGEPSTTTKELIGGKVLDLLSAAMSKMEVDNAS